MDGQGNAFQARLVSLEKHETRAQIEGAVAMPPVSEKLPVAGSKSSEDARALPVGSIPPATSTFPVLSNVAVAVTRAMAMLPVATKPFAKIWMLNACGAESCLNSSVAMSVIEDVPVTVGVPESTPSGLRVSPTGSVPTLTLHINGLAGLFAVKVKL